MAERSGRPCPRSHQPCQRLEQPPESAQPPAHPPERRGTDRQWRTHGNWRCHGNRRSHRHWPGQSHRNTSHVRDCGAAAGGSRRCGTDSACRRLDAVVSAGLPWGGRNVWTQRQGDPTQPDPRSNYSDVESIKDRHGRRILQSRRYIPCLGVQQNRMPYPSRVVRVRQLSAANA